MLATMSRHVGTAVALVRNCRRFYGLTGVVAHSCGGNAAAIMPVLL
jgi:hypothetical protein